MAAFQPLENERETGSFRPLGTNLSVLLVWPRFPHSFWGFEGVLQMLPEAAITPPLGLITVAALCPSTWTLRLLDHAFDDITDDDYRWADLMMVSSMHAQRIDTLAVLARARACGTRTFIGGPWASSEPERLEKFADHVLVGEAEDVFTGIAADLERGTARAVYKVDDARPEGSKASSRRRTCGHRQADFGGYPPVSARNRKAAERRGHQCGRNVFPVSRRVFNRERIRGQPSAFWRYAGSSSAHSSFVTTTFTASVS